MYIQCFSINLEQDGMYEVDLRQIGIVFPSSSPKS